MIIDAHAHFVPPAFLDEAASGRRTFPLAKVAAENGGFRFASTGDTAKRPVPSWEAALRRKATLFVHPTFGAPDERLKAYGLVSAVGRVTDTAIAISRLLYSAHLIRYPGVNLVISHGGAALPMVLGRLRRSFATTPAQNKDPMEGFKRLYFDTIVYDAATLRFVCEQAGADKVLMGTDLPFTIAEMGPVTFVDTAKFGAGERAAILGDNAARPFGIGA